MPIPSPTLQRRRLLGLGPALASASAWAQPATAPVDAGVLRIASVDTAVEGSLLPVLMAAFERISGTVCRVTPGNNPYGLARAGQADLVVSHYGHHDTEGFVTQGLGLWPRTVFSNQAVLVGPAHDPAGVRGLASATEALHRIARERAPFLAHANMGMAYLAHTLWFAAGQPARDGWWTDAPALRNATAVQRAAETGAYTLWGLTPFLRTRAGAGDGPLQRMEPLVTADPLLQRLMVAVPVNPERLPGVNAHAAERFVAHLLSPAVQARIAATPYQHTPHTGWAPAGRHNATALLPT